MNLYGLIGYPLGHSFSEQYFKEKFIRENIPASLFKNFPLSDINEFQSLLNNNPSLKGLSVTIPYKEKVLKFVSSLSFEVEQIGATNCIKIFKNSLKAYNTDIIGFENSFTRKLQVNHTKALILGTGGASKAVQFVLKKLGIDFLIVSRNISLDNKHISYSKLTKNVMGQYTVVINCTPVGMYPKDDVSPQIPFNLLTAEHYVFDLVYKPEKTLLLKNAEERGAVIQNGYDMLTIQAEESWKLWNA